MNVFLNGGGAGAQTSDAYKRLNQIIDKSKPCLYIPLAMTQEKYDSCYEWITTELNDIKVSHIDIVRSAEEILAKNLNDYSFVFIGGGNTFKLLHDLKKSGAYEKISTLGGGIEMSVQEYGVRPRKMSVAEGESFKLRRKIALFTFICLGMVDNSLRSVSLHKLVK